MAIYSLGPEKVLGALPATRHGHVAQDLLKSQGLQNPQLQAVAPRTSKAEKPRTSKVLGPRSLEVLGFSALPDSHHGHL